MFDLTRQGGAWRNSYIGMAMKRAGRDASLGYATMAMERAGLDHETVCKVVAKMAECYDDTTEEEAARYYCGKTR